MTDRLVYLIKELESEFAEVLDSESDMMYKIPLGLASDILEVDVVNDRELSLGIPVSESPSAVKLPKPGYIFNGYHQTESGILVPRNIANRLSFDNSEYVPPEKVFLLPLREEKFEPEPSEELEKYFPLG